MAEIVAGYDGSEQSERALARAATVAEALGSRLVVVSVGSRRYMAGVEPIPNPEVVPTPIGPVSMAPSPSEREMALRDAPPEEEFLLEEARRFLGPRGVRAEYVGEVGDPADRLLAVAEARDAEMIVVGCPSRGLLDRLLFAHPIDEQLVRGTSRDVLLVH